MRAHFGLPSVESEELDAKRPITVNFEIPYFTVSGIQVRPVINIQYTVLSFLLPCFFTVSTMLWLAFTHGRTAVSLQMTVSHARPNK